MAISLTVEILSGSLIPDEFVKLVDNIPISSAFSFIMSAKFSSDPAKIITDFVNVETNRAYVSPTEI